jgi:hypothetical protein
MAATTAMPQQPVAASEANSNPAPPQSAPILEQVIHATDNRPPEVQRFEFHQRSAKLFATSGLFTDIKGQTEQQAIAQAYVKISLGESMGFNPAESMTGIDIIQGRVAVGANLRAARMQRAGYAWDMLQLDDKGCRLRLKLNGKALMCEYMNPETGEVSDVPVVVSFMLEDAIKAGLAGKDNYKKNPRNMFFARAITNAQRWYAPGILGADILSTEEAQDLEPNAGQDAGLTAKAVRVADGIKERYAKKTSEGPASAASAPDPPSGESSKAETAAPPEPLTPEQAQAKLMELRAQVAAIEGKPQPEQASVSEKPSEPQEKPVEESHGVTGVFDEPGSKEHRSRRR